MTTLDFLRQRFGDAADYSRLPVEVKGWCRADLPGLFRDLGFNHGAEIGVFRGRFSLLLCKGIPGLRLTCVDAWTAYPGYTDYTSQEGLNQKYEEAQEWLKPYGCRFIKAWSVDAAKQIPDESLGFVYVDGNHTFEGVVSDLAAWVPKVKVGGIIAGHDYKHFRRSLGVRVVEAVDAYTKAHDISPWFVLGRLKTKPGEVRDRERSYLWVKT